MPFGGVTNIYRRNDLSTEFGSAKLPRQAADQCSEFVGGTTSD
jgi:hypothetical protein